MNKDNDWVDCLTVEQLDKIWGPDAEGTVTNWNQVDPSFPDQELTLSGPGTDSGTFDYFTDEINGEEGASRADYNASEDDNTIVQAVSGDKGGLGYFGYTYYEENQDTLKALEIDGGDGCVAPSAEAAQDGSYTPLSRPLFVYVKNESVHEARGARLHDLLPRQPRPDRRGRAVHHRPRRGARRERREARERRRLLARAWQRPT